MACESVDNRGFNLPAVPAYTDENGVKRGNDFTSDVRVRQAINLGIDRQAMIDHVLNGFGSPAYSMCDKLPWYNPEAETDFDPEQAADFWTRRDGQRGQTESEKRMEPGRSLKFYIRQTIPSARPLPWIPPTSWPVWESRLLSGVWAGIRPTQTRSASR